MHQPNYHANNQFLLMGVTIFASITAAVIISTLIIMTLMKGEIAGALSSQVQTMPTTVQNTGTCTVPAGEVQATTAQPASVEVTVPATVSFVSGVHHMLPAVHNSFNNTSTTTTTNNVTNTEINSKTVIKDSYNNDNDTTVIKDNTVNINSNNKTIDSNNTVKTNVIGNTVNSNSNNTSNTTTNTTTTTNNVIGNTTNVASNNTVNSNSNNTVTKTTNVVENHVLSDNVTVIAPSI